MPAPVVTGISPTSGPTDGGNTAVIAGTGFINTTAVNFGSTAASFTVVSSTAINVVVPRGPSGGGTVSVTVTGPGGTSGSGTTYTYVATLIPIITGLTPISGPLSGGNTVTISGSNFNGATAVTFAGKAATSFSLLSSTVINAIAPPGTAGVASVVVTTTAGSSSGFNYTYIGPPIPIAVFPNVGSTAGGNTISITGTGLAGTTIVNFGTIPATSFTVVNDTEVDVITPMHVAGQVPIAITTQGGTNSSLSFTFQLPPTINSISPTAGPVTGGTFVTISGSGLISALNVYFGNTAATALTVNSDNTLTAVAPAEAAGIRTVTVNSASATSNGALYRYLAAPVLISLTPTTGNGIGGNDVTLRGTGFETASYVIFGSNPAFFTILSDTLISAVAPAGSGAVSVTVRSPGGTSGSQMYTYS